MCSGVLEIQAKDQTKLQTFAKHVGLVVLSLVKVQQFYSGSHSGLFGVAYKKNWEK